MNPTTSTAEGAPYRFLEPQDLGLPHHYRASSICGLILNPGGSASGVKQTVIGGIISIQNILYAMTSANSLANAKHPYTVHFSSQRLDWALCQITPSLAVPNLNLSHPLLHYMQEEELIPGPVRVLGGYGPHEGVLNAELGTTISGFPWDVKMREIVMDASVKSKKSKFLMGAWVVQGQTVCGYVVQQGLTPNGKKVSCYMIPMGHAFGEIERMLGQKVVFGQELHNTMAKN